MGTNYYAVRIMDGDEKELAKELIENDQYEVLIDLINEKYSKIHIGKKSYGWKFLFNYHNGRYYEATKRSLNDFLSCHSIIDEYGKEISLESFWRIVEDSKDGMDNKQYYEREGLSKDLVMLDDFLSEKILSYKPCFYEFYNDGLRFSTLNDFS